MESNVAIETNAAAAAARLAKLRDDPTVIVHRPKVRVPFEPAIRVEGPVNPRVLLGRDDEEDAVAEQSADE